MKTFMRMAAVTALAFAAVACAPLSGQFIADYDLGDVSGVPQSGSQDGQGLLLQFRHIDLATESEYEDHKDELKGLADLAVVGTLTNTGAGALGLELWVTPGNSGALGTVDEVIAAGGVRLWGPMNLAAGASNAIGWDESAALFVDAGKQMLLDQAKGDGEFTLYLVGNNSSYTLSNAHLILVLSAGV